MRDKTPMFICDCCRKETKTLEQYDVWNLCPSCLKDAEQNEWAMQPLDAPPHLVELADKRAAEKEEKL